MLLLRDWRIEDLELMLRLNQANLPDLGSLNLEQLSVLAEQACYLRVIEKENRLAGFVLALIPDANYDSENFLWFKQRYQNFLYVDRIAIETFAQGKGCGKQLYQDLEQFCEQQGIDAITLEVNTKPRNQGSLDFHNRMGFVEVGTQDTNGGSKSVSLMRKQL